MLFGLSCWETTGLAGSENWSFLGKEDVWKWRDDRCLKRRYPICLGTLEQVPEENLGLIFHASYLYELDGY